MKINSFAILSLFSLVLGSVPRRGHRGDRNEPIEEKSRVTAFINTDNGMKVECWEIGDLIPRNQITRPDGSTGTVRHMNLESHMRVGIYTFPPSAEIYSVDMHDNAVDFRSKPNLFTVKDGLILIEAMPMSGTRSRKDDLEQYVFANLNGDDWFYVEDRLSEERCVKPMPRNQFDVRTKSGSDTTLINFEYESTPRHTVLHEGRCDFAGLQQPGRKDSDSGKSRFRTQEL